jgi:hypothetical protein
MPEIGVVRPATPPPDFDLSLALDSIERMKIIRPSAIAFAHYGLVSNVDEIFDEAQQALRQWGEVAVTAFRSGQDIDTALFDAFDWQLQTENEQYQQKVNALNGTHSNAAGFRRWLESPCGQIWVTQQGSAGASDTIRDDDSTS